MEQKKLTVCWVSAGVSSFIAGWLCRGIVDIYIYIDIADQHPDSLRFIHDCEQALKKPIQIIRNPRYRSVSDVCRGDRFIKSPAGARCTLVLKKRVRKQWEYDHRDYDITYIWGMDSNEKNRADRLNDTMPDFHHKFPLIEHGLSKDDAHGILKRLGIKRPAMYDMGYCNNNCIGCIKGGMGYWNKIRKDFPDVFADRAKMEREVGHPIIRGHWLDELDPNAGREQKIILEDCGIACELNFHNSSDYC